MPAFEYKLVKSAEIDSAGAEGWRLLVQNNGAYVMERQLPSEYTVVAEVEEVNEYVALGWEFVGLSKQDGYLMRRAMPMPIIPDAGF